ncbi:PcfK-like family protein [Pedobacter sp.]|uniref:PcfK-like family protein n=1 Tax=Pedobacter sp. TaxID=1411316 RepID=UPI003D7FD7D4
MQASDIFTNIISTYLKNLAEKDPLFAVTLGKPKKSIKECITYILNEVKKSGRNGFGDEEVFGMAVHYYDENDVQPGPKINCTVVVNQSLDAKIPNTNTKLNKKKAPKQATAIELVPVNQTSLF